MASRHPKRYQELLIRLRDARRNAGFTQETAAAAIGVRQTFISRVETGERRIDPVELQEFAELYGVEVAALLPAVKSETRA
jgi:transcriptional regulator with XRE-family HTH domain